MKIIERLMAWSLAAVIAPTGVAQTAIAAPPPAWVGVWRGTVGTAAVQVCLQHDDYQDFGAYYYLRHLTIISLGKLDKQSVWTEAPNSDQAAKGPLWRLSSMTNDRLQGTWSNGTKTLPFTLDRVALAKPALDDPDATCGSVAFSLPRFTKPVITTKAASLNGVAYTQVIADPGKQFEDSSTETFQLIGSTPAIKRINAELYKAVPTSSANATYFDCSMSALGQNGLDGDASSTIKPLIITPSWLVLESDEGDDCGGAHPNSSIGYETWDLRTGTKVNLYDWFNKNALTQTVNEPGSKNQYVTVSFTAPFRKLIDGAYSTDDEECRSTLADADGWDPSLTRTGVAFTPGLPHAELACQENAEIPFAKLTAYLTPLGKREIAGFLAEIKPRK